VAIYRAVRDYSVHDVLNSSGRLLSTSREFPTRPRISIGHRNDEIRNFTAIEERDILSTRAFSEAQLIVPRGFLRSASGALITQ
jgi:hypothetical protein